MFAHSAAFRTCRPFRDVRRIVVVGPWGAGKSRVAAALASALGAPMIEQDPLYWRADWTPTPAGEFRAKVAAATSGDTWVADGNFSSARDKVWARADTLVWLDYDLPLVFWRLARRQIRRVVAKQALWHGNRERIRDLVLPGSLLWQLPRKHARWRREYSALLVSAELSHLKVYRLRRPSDADRWLRNVTHNLPKWGPAPLPDREGTTIRSRTPEPPAQRA